MNKICTKCNELLPIEEFYKNHILKSGISNECKRCQALRKGVTEKAYPKLKVCCICNIEKPYYKFEPTRKIHRKWYCKECKSKFEVENPGEDIEKLRRIYDNNYRYQKSNINRKSRIKNFEYNMWFNAKKHAPERGLEFNIDVSDIIIPDKCPIFDKPFEFGTSRHYDWTPSLDRIDNEKGYIKGNVWVISKKANTMKNNASWDELKLFCQNILRYSPNNIENEDIESLDKELMR